jgi:hypothetical protein
MNGKPKIVITDYDYGDVSIKTTILVAAGAEVIALQAKIQEDLFEVARGCCHINFLSSKIRKNTNFGSLLFNDLRDLKCHQYNKFGRLLS